MHLLFLKKSIDFFATAKYDKYEKYNKYNLKGELILWIKINL